MSSFVGRLQGTATILRELPGQRRIPFLPDDQIRSLRDTRVRELVRHAVEHVPHYRELFRAEGIDARAVETAEDLRELPLLEKRLVQEDTERFRSRVVSDPLVVSTSGSTGTPIAIARDRDSLYAMVAHSERERAVETKLCGARYGYRVAELVNPSGNVARVQDLLGRTSFRPLRPRLHTISLAEPPERVAAELRRIRPRVIRGFGSYVELLFRARAGGAVSFPSPRVVFYSGDRMTPDGRELIEETFGVPVLSRYSAAEAIRIGYFCERRTGFHLHEDLCDLRVVGANGRELAPGEIGEVVISDLTNRGSVLLNYRLGDLAAIAPGICGCGRTGRLLTNLDGRVSEIVRLQDGALVHPIVIENAVRGAGRGILRFQVVQEAKDRFRLKILPRDDATFDQVARRLPPTLTALLGNASIEVERDRDFGFREGKFRAVVPLRDG